MRPAWLKRCSGAIKLVLVIVVLLAMTPTLVAIYLALRAAGASGVQQ